MLYFQPLSASALPEPYSLVSSRGLCSPHKNWYLLTLPCQAKRRCHNSFQKVMTTKISSTSEISGDKAPTDWKSCCILAQGAKILKPQLKSQRGVLQVPGAVPRELIRISALGLVQTFRAESYPGP